MPDNEKPDAGKPDAGKPEATKPEATKPEDAGSSELLEAAPFVDDIIIWSDDLDAPRKLTKKDLQGLPKLPSSLMPAINSLIKQGVTIAAIPTTSGIGAACYLVNLATLKKPDDET
jgi:hypothetical protein